MSLFNTAPITLEAATPAAPWVTLDLETGDAPAAAVTDAIAAWKAPSNWKPETVANRRQEAAVRIREKSALLDAAPILCMALRSPDEQVVWNGMDAGPHAIEDWRVDSRGDERNMLIAIREWLDRRTDPTTLLVGHNHRNFDLPKLRTRFVHHRLRLPRVLTPKLGDAGSANETVDTMALFRAFSPEHRDNLFVDLETVARHLGIPRPKQVVSGAEVPRLHREGNHLAVLVYCCVDVATTSTAFQLMTSTAPGLA